MTTPADFSLDHPTTFSRDAGAGIMPYGGGYTAGPTIDFGGGSALLSSGPQGIDISGVTHSYAPTHMASGVNDTNGFVAQQLCINTSETKSHASGRHQLVFVVPDSEKVGIQAPLYHLYGWPELNRILRSMENKVHGRPRWKDVWNGSELVRYFRFWGCQNGSEQARAAYIGSDFFAFKIARRIRTFNYWLAVGSSKGRKKGSVHTGDTLFIIVRRYEDINTAAQPFLSSGSSAVQSNHRPAKRHKGNNELVTQYSTRFQSDEEATALGTTRYYWQFEPYISVTGSPPPRHLYVNKAGIGAYIRVGMVTNMFGNTGVAGLTNQARDAIRPAHDDGAYLKALETLPEIEVMLRC